MAIAKDIMTASPLMLTSGMDILDAVEFFNKHHISSAPVQNPLGEILGHLTEIDLVKALAQYRSNSEYSKVIHAEEYFEPVIFVKDTDKVAEVVRALVKAPTYRVLVKDRQNRTIGIISPKDILRSIQRKGPVGQIVVDEVKALRMELDHMRKRMQEMTSYLATYDTVFQSGLFGLHSADKTGRIVFANERLHTNLGYKPGEIIGKSIYDIYPAEIHALVTAGLKRVMDEGRQNLIFSKMVKRDGSMMEVDIASAALKDEMGRFIGTFTVSRQHGTPAMAQQTGEIFEVAAKKVSGK